MVAYKTFLDTVSSVIVTLDIIESCSWAVLVDSMQNASVTMADAVEILQKMDRSGVLVFDGDIVCITAKGRYMAGDVRAVTAKQVCP